MRIGGTAMAMGSAIIIIPRPASARSIIPTMTRGIEIITNSIVIEMIPSAEMYRFDFWRSLRRSGRREARILLGLYVYLRENRSSRSKSVIFDFFFLTTLFLLVLALCSGGNRFWTDPELSLVLG